MSAVAATLRTALADGWANRSSFGFQMLLMIVNDITWVLFWALFFNRVGTIRGWNPDDVYVLFSILLVSSGAALGLLANSRRIGQLAADGALDETLVLPVAALPHILTMRIDAALMGDLAFGPVLFLLAGHPTPERTALFVLGSLAGTVVLVGFLVATGALTLFVGGRGEQGDLGFNAILLFASYPLDIFGGATKVLLFTAVPAAFVTGLPARLVRDFDAATAALLLGMAAFFAVFGWAVFSLGLRRYSSGSVWMS
jgi:ABC-2 type transport system permease protein